MCGRGQGGSTNLADHGLLHKAPVFLLAICHDDGVSQSFKNNAGAAGCMHGSWSHHTACIGRGVH